MTSTTSRWRVARVDRTQALLLDCGETRTERAVPLKPGGLLERTVGEPTVPAVGDAVVLAGERALLLPRRSELVRDTADRTSHTQVIAANLDVVMIVEHLDPAPSLGRIERFVALAWESGATPVVALTKADLHPDPEAVATQAQRVAPGVSVSAVSAMTGEGLDGVRSFLVDDVTVALVGPSGAGKSTLVNALAGAEVMATGERRSDGKGRHTTTHRRLLPLEGGTAWVIDTPGVRAVGLVAQGESLERGFPDVVGLAAKCRFRDCGHHGEPGCAIEAAVADGTLDADRLASWRSYERETARQRARMSGRLAQEVRAQGKEHARRVRDLKRVGKLRR